MDERRGGVLSLPVWMKAVYIGLAAVLFSIGGKAVEAQALKWLWGVGNTGEIVAPSVAVAISLAMWGMFAWEIWETRESS